jgi:hypothetical protein
VHQYVISRKTSGALASCFFVTIGAIRIGDAPMADDFQSEMGSEVATAARGAVSALAESTIGLQRQVERSGRDWLEFVKEEEARHEAEIAQLKDRIHRFLDSVRRPVGELKYELPISSEASRAIAALFEAVGRNP